MDAQNLMWIWLAGVVVVAGAAWLVAKKPWQSHAHISGAVLSAAVEAINEDVVKRPGKYERVTTVRKPTKAARETGRVQITRK